MNWFAITIISIWFCAAIGTLGCKNWLPFFSAAVVTVLAGIGYVMSRSL